MEEMITAFLADYAVLLVVGVCLCLGFVLKNLVPSNAVNKYIPTIMAAVGVLLNAWINLWSFTPEILLGGMFSGLASTGLYEAFRNFIEKKE